ncbi:unnamed protein product [Peniophora sp. CBMAI 1063]|nr:unnamed protein product [Peniophora sp. CBMAI 1063]
MQFFSDLLPDAVARAPLSSRNANGRLETDRSRAKLTPKDLLQLPSVGISLPNPAGTVLALPYSVWSHDRDTELNFLRISLISAPTESEAVLYEIRLQNPGDAFWYDDDTLVIPITDASEHTTSLYACPVARGGQHEKVATTVNEIGELVGRLPTDSAGNFRYSPDAHTLVFTAQVFQDSELATAVSQERAWDGRKDTARAYNGQSYVRHWSHYTGPMRSSLFTTSLLARGEQWELGGIYTDLLKGTTHQVPSEDTPGNDFDVSASQVVYTTKDASLREAVQYKKNIFVTDINGRSPPRELTSGVHGGAFTPVFSPDGQLVAWLEQESDATFDAKNQIVLYNIETGTRSVVLREWDRSPSSIVFSSDSSKLYLTAPDAARVKIFAFSLSSAGLDTATPIQLTQTGEATGLRPLPDSRLAYTYTTLTSPGSIHLLSVPQDLSDLSTLTKQVIVDPSANIQDSRREYSKMEEFWFDGDSRKIHGYVLKPKDWTPERKWPVVLLIHGGPQWVWGDAWSAPFNTQIFSEQGYFVVCINPSGSISFGQEYTDAVTGDWGGTPLRDIAKGFKGALKAYSEIDPKRAFAFGASYGGYMINLLQGQAATLGLEFAAVASLCGIFNTEYLSYTMDELFFMRHDWLGWPWEKKARSLHEALSPHKFVDRWRIPQLVMHGDQDYRVPITEGTATFNALQQRGIPSRLIVFEKESHIFTNRNNILMHFNEVFAWFERFSRST